MNKKGIENDHSLKHYIDCFKDDDSNDENNKENLITTYTPNNSHSMHTNKPQSAKINPLTPSKPLNQNEFSLLFPGAKKANIKESKSSPSKFQDSQPSIQASFPIFSSFPSSLITQPHELEETTQSKRIKFNETVSNTDLIDTQPKPLENKHKKQSLNSTDDDIHFSNISINSNSSSSPPKVDNTFYGLPIKVKDLLKKHRNISCLYDWQDDLLNIMHEKLAAMNKIFKDFSSNRLTNIDDINEHSFYMNLLYLSPTSGGKTLVAELLILYTLLVLRKSCIFVMPFVSIVQEKVQLMIPFADELNFLVEEYAGVKGSLPPIKRQKKPTLYICTIEKAHSLVNSLIESDRLSKEIGLVVADELHMIGDGSRGAVYEMILSKVKYCSKLAIESNLKLIRGANPASSNTKSYLNQPIQIVATTATLQNKSELAKFLDAFMYERDFRPVELKEYIKVGTQVFEVDKANINKYDEDSEGFVKPVRNLDLRSYTNQMKTADPDGLIALVSLVYFLLDFINFFLPK